MGSPSASLSGEWSAATADFVSLGVVVPCSQVYHDRAFRKRTVSGFLQIVDLAARSMTIRSPFLVAGIYETLLADQIVVKTTKPLRGVRSVSLTLPAISVSEPSPDEQSGTFPLEKAAISRLVDLHLRDRPILRSAALLIHNSDLTRSLPPGIARIGTSDGPGQAGVRAEAQV